MDTKNKLQKIIKKIDKKNNKRINICDYSTEEVIFICDYTHFPSLVKVLNSYFTTRTVVDEREKANFFSGSCDIKYHFFE